MGIRKDVSEVGMKVEGEFVDSLSLSLPALKSWLQQG